MLRVDDDQRRRVVGFILFGLCLIGFGLRTQNINWDAGTHQHPDERFWTIVTDGVSSPDGIADYFDSDNSAFNPYNNDFPTFVYGTWPLGLTKATATWLQQDGPVASTLTKAFDAGGVDLRSDDGPRFNNQYDSQLIGRLLSALFDTATILVVFAIGRRLSGTTAGLLGAGLQTFAVLHIQYSHFYGSETLAAFAASVAVLLALRIAGGDTRTRILAATGTAVGFTVAAKLSTVAVVSAPVGAIVVASWSELRRSVHAVVTTITQLSFFGLVSVAIFRVLQPYAFGQQFGLKLDQRYLDDLDYLTGINDGSSNVPWTIQWIGKSGLTYPLKSAALWGMGPALAVAVALGVTIGAMLLVRRRRTYWVVPLLFLAVEVVLVSRQFNGLIRYLLPAYPTAIAVGGVGLAYVIRGAMGPPKQRFRRRALATLGAAITLGTMFWGLAFTFGVYGQPHSRLVASQWMADNIAPGEVVTHSVWDDALPLRLPSTQNHGIQIVDVEPFARDSADKIETLIATLDEVDYVVEASNRLYDSVSEFPARYPSTNRYYEALFDGSLGFAMAAEFSNPPSLFGITIDDRSSEETFTVYDHPTVTIWKKTAAWSTLNARRVIGVDQANNSFDATHNVASANALQLTSDQYDTQQRGGTFTDVFDVDGWSSNVPWLWWYIWLQLAAFAAVPWVTWLFRRLPGEGYAFSKAFGTLAVATVSWVLVANNLLSASSGLAWAVLGVLVAVGAVIARRRSRDLRRAVRANRRAWFGVEAVFTGLFALVVLLRMQNPDLWHQWTGGEKPMETAYFTAVTRSTTLPPYDPWFAGGSLNYYYFGYWMLSLPTRALRLAPEVAFNLGLPTVAALAGSTAFGLGQSLAGLVRRGSTKIRHLGSSWAGLFAVIMLLLIGNIEGFLQWNRQRGLPNSYDWWAPSRVNDGLFDITEFPFWSLLFGDLHPHVMGMVTLGVTMACALGFAVAGRAKDLPRMAMFAVSLGLVSGLVRMTHTWDLPVAFIVIAGATTVGTLHAHRRRLFGFHIFLGYLAIAAVAHQLLVGPYLAHSQTFDAGIGPSVATSQFGDVLTQFGLFIAVALAFVALWGWRQRGTNLTETILIGVTIWGAITVGIQAKNLPSTPVVVLGIALAVALCLIAFRELRRPQPAIAMAGVAALFALGVSVIIGVDLLTINNDIERLNTVFKFWYQAWHLLAIASAVAMWMVFSAAWRFVGHVRPASHARAKVFVRRRAIAAAGAAVLATVLLASLAYPLAAPSARNNARFVATSPTLDGLAFLDIGAVYSSVDQTTTLGDDLPLIEFLRNAIEGTPTIVEAVGPLYSWSSRMSIHTGLPAVLGWDWHQIQQRTDFRADIEKRRSEVADFYRNSNTEEQSRFLRTYDVSYVVVGTQEWVYGDPDALESLRFHPALFEVFRDGKYAIYEVDKPILG